LGKIFSLLFGNIKEYLNILLIRFILMVKKNRKKKELYKSFLGKVWYFIWYDDSLLSWIVNVILAFLIVKFIFYPLLSLFVGTSLPLVAVVSSSMEHRGVDEGSVYRMCGGVVDDSNRFGLDEWWDVCGAWYEENFDIYLSDFRGFPLSDGFNKGDIILLRGAQNIDLGDVVVFHSGKKYPIIHRVVGFSNEGVVTKGDNNPGLIRDSELDESDVNVDVILGKAYARIPYLGYVKIWFSNFIGLFAN
jgi:signal peptidase I